MLVNEWWNDAILAKVEKCQGKIKVRGLSKIESIIYCGFDTSCKQLQI